VEFRVLGPLEVLVHDDAEGVALGGGKQRAVLAILLLHRLVRLLKRINAYLVRWASWKYKRLRRHPAKARRFLAAVYRRQPGLFAHWQFGARPDGWTIGAG
jgi:hypothetical protein